MVLRYSPARVLVTSAPIIDFTVKAVVIPEVFRPCGEHCLVFLMTELPDFDFPYRRLSSGSRQL